MGVRPKMCRFCDGADASREKNGLIRCVRKHKFVKPDDCCPSYGYELSDVEKTVLEFFRKGNLDDRQQVDSV